MSNLTPTCPNCKCLSDVILKARDGRLVCINCANAQVAAAKLPDEKKVYDMPSVEEVVAAGYPASAHSKIMVEREELLKRLADSPAEPDEPKPLPPIEVEPTLVEHKLPVDLEPETPWSEESVSKANTTALEESFVAPQPDTKSEKLGKKSDKKKSR
jgi:hypothetical protein